MSLRRLGSLNHQEISKEDLATNASKDGDTV